jgi:hypothetical protein
MFSLNKESLNLANVNLRKEMHGEEQVLAVDLKLEFETSNAVLKKFSATLLDALYTQDPGAARDMINPDHAPTLRNPQMGEIKWALEMPFVRFGVFADGTNEEEIVFSAAKCNHFRFVCKEGGTVLLTFRIQKSEPMEMDVTKLVFLMGKSIKVSLEPEDEPEEVHAEFDRGTGGLFIDIDSDADGDSGDATHDEGSTGNTAPELEPTGDADDPRYQEAVAFVRELNKAKPSILVRNLKIGAPRATVMLQTMEAEGIVGPEDSKGSRDVLETTS